MEPDHTTIPKEIGLVLEATAPTQEIATTIALLSRQPLLHNPVAEWKGAVTTFACLHNPAHIDRGLCTGSISIMLPCLTTRKRCSE